MSRHEAGADGTRNIGTVEYAVVGTGGILLAIALRLSLAPFPSGDFTQFTGDWFAAIGRMGIVPFLASDVTNYAPAYTYLMVLAHVFFGWLPPVVAIKMVGFPFDFLCAYYISRLVSLRYPNGAVGLLAFLLTLFLPTLVINSAMWGQADVIYTSGLVAFVYYVATRRDVAAGLALGLAFSVKLQTVFVAPLVLLVALSGCIRWRTILLVPAVYVASILPAWVAGRPLGELLTVYLRQAGYYSRLTSNAPQVYQWFPASMYEWMLPAGLLWATAVVGIFTYVLYRRRPQWTPERLVQVAALCVVLVPYCVPKMHERYFFPADILTVVLAFYRPRLALVPVVVTAVSFFSYAPFLLRTVVIPLPYLAIVMGGVLVALLYDLGRSDDLRIPTGRE